MMKRILICIAVMITFSGCKRWYEIPVPSYIQIDTYTTKVAPTGVQGTSNQNFTDMMVIANGQSYGIFPLGSKIPVLISGQTHFIIKGVVEINGVSSLRAAYEVMKGCDSIISVMPGKVTNVVPVFEYFSTITFPWTQSFDAIGNNGTTLISSCNCNTDTTIRIHSPGMNSANCLELMPWSGQTTSMVQTQHLMYLPAGGVGIYMEFNYMGNVPINIAIQGIPTNGTSPTAITSCGGVYSSTTWNKAYISLTEQVSTLQSGYYYIYITSLYDGLVAGNNYALIDNIKIAVAG